MPWTPPLLHFGDHAGALFVTCTARITTALHALFRLRRRCRASYRERLYEVPPSVMVGFYAKTQQWGEPWTTGGGDGALLRIEEVAYGAVQAVEYGHGRGANGLTAVEHGADAAARRRPSASPTVAAEHAQLTCNRLGTKLSLKTMGTPALR
jgi:hypothetical protein